MVAKISDKDFKDAIKEGFCVVDFSASWCGPCQMMAPVFEKVSEELKDSVKFFKIDVDESPNTAEEFTIMGVPSILIFKNGTHEAIQTGFMNEDMLKAFIDRNK